MDDRRGTRDERRGINISKRINSVRDLNVYKLAFDASMEIFEISKNFPEEERYSLIDQLMKIPYLS